MKNRYKDWNIYRFRNKLLEKQEFLEKVETYKKIEEILSNWNKSEDIIDEKNKIGYSIVKDIRSENKKNILSFSSFQDIRIWSWKDSTVFSSNNKNYIYKEAFKWGFDEFLYVKNKYLILKKYLWDVIPKSYFIYWESYNWKLDWIKKWFEEKVFTIQQRVKWKDLSKLTFEEKKEIILLEKLKNAHKKYILLKYFLASRLKELWFSENIMDLQLDLGDLSNKDSFPQEDIDFLKDKLKSPNIMRDWENIFFIDFGSWVWDEQKQKIFDYMMRDDIFELWLWALKIYNLDIKK